MPRRPETTESVTLQCRECGLTTFAPGWQGTVQELQALHQRTCTGRVESRTA